MSMPSDLISMLMNQGGGGVNPPLLDPRMQPPNPQPQMPEMGPEEAKVMSMFSPPKTPEEEDQIVSKWEQFTNQFKTKPGWDRA